MKKEEYFQQLMELLKSGNFGWDKELSDDGTASLEKLLEQGTILGRDGKRIPGKAGRDEKKLQKELAKRLKNDKAVYIYKKGEEYPREVRFDPKEKRFKVSEPVNQMELQPVKKPHWFKRWYLNLFSLMFRGKSIQSVRDWKRYSHRQEAFKNAMATKRVERRRQFDPILHEKQFASLDKTAEQPKAETELTNVAAEEKPTVEQLLTRIDELTRKVQELQREKEAAAKNSEPKPMELDGSEAVGKLEKQKSFFRTQPEPVKPESPVKGLDTVLKEPEKKPQSAEKDESKPQSVPAKEEQAKPGFPTFENREQKDETPCDLLLDQLRKQKNGALPSQTERNIRELYRSAERAKAKLQDEVDKGRRFEGGPEVCRLVAFNSVKKQIESGGLSRETEMILNSEIGTKVLTTAAGMSEDMKYAERSGHSPGYFNKHFLQQEGLDRMTELSNEKMQDFLKEHFAREDELQKSLEQPPMAKVRAGQDPLSLLAAGKPIFPQTSDPAQGISLG